MKQRVCSICGKTTKYQIDIEKFVKEKKWRGSVLNRGKKRYEFWYCPAHSIEETDKFERETMQELGIE